MARGPHPWGPYRVGKRILFGDERSHPHPIRGFKRWLGIGVIASAKRDPSSGVVKARGMRRTADGWRLTKSRRQRTYRPGEVDPSPGARSKARATQRQTARANRGRRAGRPAETPQTTNPNLARRTRQNADGTMRGSVSGIPRMPTPRQAVGLQRLGCDFCRGRGVRPLTQGKGRVKTVIGTAPCSHSWAVPNHGPGQAAPDRWDSLVCPPCENKGKVEITVRRKGGTEVKVKVPCFTCKGWIVHW